ncbi:unnamed protein product, partial [Musa hybrid cultivar]
YRLVPLKTARTVAVTPIFPKPLSKEVLFPRRGLIIKRNDGHHTNLESKSRRNASHLSFDLPHSYGQWTVEKPVEWLWH